MDQLYRVIYYHQAVRSASVILKLILKRSSKLFHDGDQSVFPRRVNGNENLVRKLFIKGEKIDIEDYTRIMDAQIWVLIDEWCDCKDPILCDLCQRLISRNLFKSIIINDSYEAEKLKEKAVNLVSKNSSFISESDASDYYVNVDVSKRKTYKQDDAIWLFEDGKPKNTTG
ncbi:hypothetical protein HRE53_31595 (plasmid) [Acaryochloris sp. 'Moss Beach']|uniref:hypothetical protein n=1 Tax=Acaryochloris sp. 'Moss Beach' TaxID=2740837 RepID=UPI001F287CC5|nr:hypothetical protein [Acaryochloris sp. 'Moss Beach']UJB73243.1 hypothetical protein HRE53_31595 [Acaryochloris sp. 'Moss Beach']